MMISTTAIVVSVMVGLIALAFFFPPKDEDIDDFQPLGVPPKKSKKRQPKRGK